MAKFRRTAFFMGLVAGYVAKSLKGRGVAGRDEASRTLGQTGSSKSVLHPDTRSSSLPQNEDIEGAEQISREI